MRFDDGTSRVGSDPFVTAREDRAPVRRLRGRLAAPVTVWTALSAEGAPVGLTVSSVLAAEGDPPEILGIIDPLSDLWDAVKETRRFVVNVLTSEHARLAERFALRFPGDPFADVETVATPSGPELGASATRVACTLLGSSDAGYGRLVRARMDELTLDERTVRPLVYYRGTYVSTGPLRD